MGVLGQVEELVNILHWLEHALEFLRRRVLFEHIRVQEERCFGKGLALLHLEEVHAGSQVRVETVEHETVAEVFGFAVEQIQVGALEESEMVLQQVLLEVEAILTKERLGVGHFIATDGFEFGELGVEFF